MGFVRIVSFVVWLIVGLLRGGGKQSGELSDGRQVNKNSIVEEENGVNE